MRARVPMSGPRRLFDKTETDMPNIRERRLADLRKQVTRFTEQRDETIAKLIKLDGKLRMATKAVTRAEKRLQTEPAKQPAARPATPVEIAVAPLPPDLQKEYRETADEPAIPDFLQRKAEGERKDAEARAEILAEQEASKRRKASARIGKMKAAKAGDTKRMPLSGKAALAAIMKS